jgi:hypothetical protein
VQNDRHAIPGAKLEVRNMLGCAKAWRIPLDLLADTRISVKDNLPQRQDRRLERVIERREKCLDLLCARGFRRHRTLLSLPRIIVYRARIVLYKTASCMMPQRRENTKR